MKWPLSLLFALCPALAMGQSIEVPATVQVDTPGLVVIRATKLDADGTASGLECKPSRPTL